MSENIVLLLWLACPLTGGYGKSLWPVAMGVKYSCKKRMDALLAWVTWWLGWPDQESLLELTSWSWPVLELNTLTGAGLDVQHLELGGVSWPGLGRWMS